MINKTAIGKLVYRIGWIGFISLLLHVPLHVVTGQTPLVSISTSATLSGIEWSPDSTLLAASGTDGVNIYDSKLELITTLISSAWSYSRVAWSQDGTLLASNIIDNTVKIWSRNLSNDTFNVIETLTLPHKYAAALAWNPVQNQLAILVVDQPEGFNDPFGTIELWNEVSGDWTLVQSLTPDKAYRFPVPTIIWSPDGQSIAGIGNGCRNELCLTPDPAFVFTLNVTTGATTKKYEFEIPPYSIVWSARNQIAIAVNDVSIVNAATGNFVSLLPKPDLNFNTLHDDWNSDGKRLVVGSELIGEFVIFDADTGVILKSFTSETDVSAIDWSPDDDTIAVVYQSGLIELWDVSELSIIGGA